MKSLRLYIVHAIFSFLPATRFFRLKASLLRWAGAAVGSNVRIVSSARFFLTGHLTIGDDTWIGHEVLIVGGDADVSIGRKVDIAPRVTLVTGTHELLTTPGRTAGRGYSLPILIEDGVWIGTSATILGGVKVHELSMVAAGSLVRDDVPSRSMVGGIPSRVINRHDTLTVEAPECERHE